MATKKLTRSNNKIVSGVAAGIAEYLSIDPTIIRVLWALFTLWNLPLGIVVYFILALVLPAGDDPVKASANPFSDEEIIVKDA